MNVPLRSALALSALLHALICVWGEVRGAARESSPALVADRFSGNGIELETIPVEPASGTEGVTRTTSIDSPPIATDPPALPASEPIAAEPPRPPPKVPPKAARPTPLDTEGPLARPSPSPSGTTSSSERQSAPHPSAAGDARASGAESAANPAGASAAYGAPGLPPGVRHLPRAFTRALALANRGDTRWREVAAGRVGEARLVLAVDAEGQLGELEYASDDERERLAPVVKKLFANTLLLLKNGRFSVDPKTLAAGVTRLRVTVEVTDGGPRSADGDPVELFGLGSAAPEAGKPGKSGFVLNSGRQVTAWVWVE
jgi:hypothetical protein